MRKNKVKAQGDVEKKNLIVSERFYLAEAVFLIGFEGDDLELLRRLDYALHNPHWFLFLGRKAFVPSEPIWLKNGVCESQNLEVALTVFPRLSPERKGDEKRMRLVIQVKPGERGEITRRDQPISFVKGKRQFDVRDMRTNFCDDRPLLNDKEAP